jgi:hypothetical protein
MTRFQYAFDSAVARQATIIGALRDGADGVMIERPRDYYARSPMLTLLQSPRLCHYCGGKRSVNRTCDGCGAPS